MSEEQAPSVDASATPAPTLPETGTPASKGATPPKSDAPTLEEALARLNDLERKHKNASEELDRHRKNAKKLADYEEAERKAQEAQLSEIERAQKQYADLQSRHDTYVATMQSRFVRYEIERQATKLGIIDPDAAARLIDQSELEYDDDGTPTNAEKLLEKLLKNKPYLAPQQVEQQQQATPATQQQQPLQGRQQLQPAPFVPAVPPAVPAMNPGRTNIAQPNTFPPGRPPRLADVWRKQK